MNKEQLKTKLGDVLNQQMKLQNDLHCVSGAIQILQLLIQEETNALSPTDNDAKTTEAGE